MYIALEQLGLNSPSLLFFSLITFTVYAIQYIFFNAIKCNLMELANVSSSSRLERLCDMHWDPMCFGALGCVIE